MAIAGSLAVFAGSYAGCHYLAGLDGGASWAIAGAADLRGATITIHPGQFCGPRHSCLSVGSRDHRI